MMHEKTHQKEVMLKKNPVVLGLKVSHLLCDNDSAFVIFFILVLSIFQKEFGGTQESQHTFVKGQTGASQKIGT